MPSWVRILLELFYGWILTPALCPLLPPLALTFSSFSQRSSEFLEFCSCSFIRFYSLFHSQNSPAYRTYPLSLNLSFFPKQDENRKNTCMHNVDFTGDFGTTGSCQEPSTQNLIVEFFLIPTGASSCPILPPHTA